MAKEGLLAVAAGVMSALAALSIISGTPLAMSLSYFAPLPLYMAGFAWGAKAAGFAALGGVMTAGMLGGVLSAVPYAVAMALPAWLVSRQVMLSRPGPGGTTEWFPPGEVAAWLTLIALAGLVSVGIGWGLQAEGLAAAVRHALDEGIGAMAPHLDATQRGQAIDLVAPAFPGMIGASWVIMTVVNAALAQGILVRMGKNAWPSPSCVDMTLPQWASLPLVAAAAVALVGSGDLEYMGRNLAIVAAVPFFFLGLAVVHKTMRRLGAAARLLLIAFYIIVVFSAWAAMAVAGVGVLELWVGLRDRFTGRGIDEENE